MIRVAERSEMEGQRLAVVLSIESILVAASLTFVSWAGLNLAPYRKNWFWVGYPGALFSIPGGLVATLLAGLFSPQGFHGIDDFAWVVPPINLVFYFVVSFLILRRMRRNKA
jgi:hypothetical protein